MEQLKPKEQLGLYRDDGLGVVELPGPESERLRKNIINIFFKHNLRITPEATIKTTDLLDVQFCLESGVYKPFKKDCPSTSSSSPTTPDMTKKKFRQIYHLVRISFCQSRHSTSRPSGWPDTRSTSPKVTTGSRGKGMLCRSIPPPIQRARSAPTTPESSSHTDMDGHFPKGSPRGKFLNRNSVKVPVRTLEAPFLATTGGSAQHPVEKGCNCRVAKDYCPWLASASQATTWSTKTKGVHRTNC